MSRLHEVQIGALAMDRLGAVIGVERLRSFHATAAVAREALAGRTVWNVNSTAVGAAWRRCSRCCWRTPARPGSTPAGW